MLDTNTSKKNIPNQSCPLGVDLRVIIKKRLSGDFSGAYKYYKSKVLFPEVISRVCSKTCLNSRCSAKNQYQRLVMNVEKACLKLNAEVEELTVIPHKWRRAAVLGGGLGGVACAILLRNKGYNVDVYEKGDALVTELKAQIPDNVLEQEFYKPINLLQIKVFYRSDIQDLEICDHYDVVCNTENREWEHRTQENLFNFFEESPEAIIALVSAGAKQVAEYLDSSYREKCGL